MAKLSNVKVHFPDGTCYMLDFHPDCLKIDFYWYPWQYKGRRDVVITEISADNTEAWTEDVPNRKI